MERSSPKKVQWCNIGTVLVQHLYNRLCMGEEAPKLSSLVGEYISHPLRKYF